MKICTKIESYNKIIELNLNRFPEKIFKKSQTKEIQTFIKQHPARYYAIRDKSKPGGEFKLKVEKQNIFNALSAVELVASELAYYDGIIAKYGESAPRDNMLQSKRVKLEELRSLIEKIDFE